MLKKNKVFINQEIMKFNSLLIFYRSCAENLFCKPESGHRLQGIANTIKVSHSCIHVFKKSENRQIFEEDIT